MKFYNNFLRFFKFNNKINLNTENNYSGAGCIFTDNKLVLCGYQPYKKNPYISGIGGKKIDNETEYIKTAIRELIEELFDIHNLSDKIYNKLYDIKPKKIMSNDYDNNYVCCVYDFNQLNRMLGILISYNLESNLYSVFPSNISDLIFNRHIKNAEISHLCLLPVVNNNIIIDNEFNKDIKLLSKCIK